MKARITNGAVEIEIYGVKISGDAQKKFMGEMPTFIAKAGGVWPADEPELKMLEFKQVKQVITITGSIDKDSVVSSPGKSYAYEVIDELVDLLTDGGTVTLEIQDNTFDDSHKMIDWSSEAYASKLSYHNPLGDEDIPLIYDVVISFIKGKELV